MRRILLVVLFASGCAFDPSGQEMAESQADASMDDVVLDPSVPLPDAEPPAPEPAPDAEPEWPDEPDCDDHSGPGHGGGGGGGGECDD